MRKSLISPRAFDASEAETLRRVFTLALNALGYTHVVDHIVECRLAEAVLESYVLGSCPCLPLSEQEVEDLAVESIELLIRGGGIVLIRKH